MELNLENLYNSMLDSASQSFGDGWNSIKNYAPSEFKKMANQLLDIAENVKKYLEDETQGYSPETGKILLQMQVRATESVLVAISSLTLLAVQNAINGIFDILKSTFSELVPFI